MNNTNILEREYSFIIPITSLNKGVPSEIGSYKLVSSKKLTVEDTLFERRNNSLKEENIGLRIRKFENKLEFTYKKFLEIIDGIAHYDEQNQNIDLETYENLLNEKFKNINIPILSTLSEKGNLFLLFSIFNKRRIYRFKSKTDTIDLIVENIAYKGKSKEVRDGMIEIEVISETFEKKKIEAFKNKIQTIFKATPAEEGKNSRGLRLLK